jgi:ABC-type phosphate transport system auxiliary subunit
VSGKSGEVTVVTVVTVVEVVTVLAVVTVQGCTNSTFWPNNLGIPRHLNLIFAT